MRESLQEVVAAARESEKRLQDDIRARAVKCGEALKTAQRDLSANLVRDYTALDSKLKGQDDALMRVDRRHEEGIAGCVPHARARAACRPSPNLASADSEHMCVVQCGEAAGAHWSS